MGPLCTEMDNAILAAKSMSCLVLADSTAKSLSSQPLATVYVSVWLSPYTLVEFDDNPHTVRSASFTRRGWSEPATLRVKPLSSVN